MEEAARQLVGMDVSALHQLLLTTLLENDGDTAAHRAAASGNIELLICLHHVDPASLTVRNHNGKLPR